MAAELTAHIVHPPRARARYRLVMRPRLVERIEAIAGECCLREYGQLCPLASRVFKHLDHASQIPLAISEGDVDLSDGNFGRAIHDLRFVECKLAILAQRADL